MVPGAVLMPWRFQVSGIMVLFYGGEASGHGFAAALFGDVNPVGVPWNRTRFTSDSSVFAAVFASRRAFFELVR